MKKRMLAVTVAVGLAGCVQPQAAPEDGRLRQAYAACINTAEGSPEKLHSCQAVLDVLRQEQRHQPFAEQETVRVMDYQKCIQALHSGDGQAYHERCGKLWQEIRANNHDDQGG
ncbi:ChiQ/YbfN family lipoprotein [Serratia rhizosphaerae]|uniref:ChiQ/YbfN family lipoprotein n=1 Tax=Serratia rhizosphaerae TaxID=2597702 RepID=UPI002DBD9428|nr:ChiQ/YbfN family lipoprotein [Serratia rhizosphaerae]MEB6335904.1 ChiQ/YbfN family lipoprotein [Serratia rhizosphaerae]